MLIRHGHTEWSRSGRYQGRCDPPLVSEGRDQARQLGQRLKGQSVVSVLTSPLRRASETASIVAESLGLGVPLVDPRLAEMAYGQWEGMTQAEIRLRWPDQLRQWKLLPDSAAPPAGETLVKVRERLNEFFADPLWHQPIAGRVLIVSHLGPIRVALLQAAQQPLSLFRQIPVPTASVHHLMLGSSRGGFKLYKKLQEQKPCALQ
ncbi:histidine phosphatase family protein [Oleiagrimonas sp.]|uniref:histidine phosphatase family protein n=1 Tax=Oleiagrimonas sp. TaxID=2010330 RepID=UPI002637B10B|nr:histidine phosphatase family protein [Oleiagrimonas sp.]MDA3913547.1 histidine phosphatase family protein [Oleiagrimonas sp.]